MPVRSPKFATWLASAGTRPWSSSAVGRSVRASVEQLLHRLRGERLDLLELGAQPGRDVERGGLQAQQDRGQRLVDLVVEVLRDPGALLLLGADDGAAALEALLLDAGEHPVEGGGQTLDVARGVRVDGGALARGDRGRRAPSSRRRCSSGSRRWRSSSVLTSTALTTATPISRSRCSDARPAAVGGEHRGDERRHRDERRVDGQNLGQKRAGAHRYGCHRQIGHLFDPGASPHAPGLRRYPFVKY